MKNVESNDQTIEFLFGRITDVETNQDGGKRFLPVRMLVLRFNTEYGTNVEILDEIYGGYPCCACIYPKDFTGIISSCFIFGIWKVPF